MGGGLIHKAALGESTSDGDGDDVTSATADAGDGVTSTASDVGDGTKQKFSDAADAYRHSDFANSNVGEYLGNLVPGLSQWHQTVGNENGNNPGAAIATTAIQIAAPVVAARMHNRAKMKARAKSVAAHNAELAKKRAAVAEQLERAEITKKEMAEARARTKRLKFDAETRFVTNPDNIEKVRLLYDSYMPAGSQQLNEDGAMQLLSAIYNGNSKNISDLYNDPRFRVAAQNYTTTMHKAPIIKDVAVIGDVDRSIGDYAPAFTKEDANASQRALFDKYYSSPFPKSIGKSGYSKIGNNNVFVTETWDSDTANFGRLIELLQHEKGNK